MSDINGWHMGAKLIMTHGKPIYIREFADQVHHALRQKEWPLFTRYENAQPIYVNPALVLGVEHYYQNQDKKEDKLWL